MQHDWDKYFDTETDYWKKIQRIYQDNEEYPKEVVSGRNLHHKFLRSFSKKENEPVDNDSENLVSLDLADHYLVHYYLWKCTRKGWRTFTARAFAFMNKNAQKYITDETVELLAQEYKKALKDIKFTEEHKRKISESMKGRKPYNVTNETRKKMSEAKKNQSVETRKKISESLKGHKGWTKGKPRSEETRKKLSEAKKGKPSHNKGKHWKLIDGKRVYY